MRKFIHLSSPIQTIFQRRGFTFANFSHPPQNVCLLNTTPDDTPNHQMTARKLIRIQTAVRSVFLFHLIVIPDLTKIMIQVEEYDVV
jgi:hypothetical protein